MIKVDVIDVHTKQSICMKMFPTIPQVGDIINFKDRESFIVKYVEWLELSEEFVPRIFVS